MNRARTLLVVFNRIGDLTLSTPLFRALAESRELSLLTRPFGAPLLGGQPYVQRVYTLEYPNRGRSRWGSIALGGHRRALGRRLAAAGFDEVLIYATERNVIRAWLRGVFGDRVREMPRAAPPRTHASELYRSAAVAVGCDVAGYDRVPRLEITAPARVAARRLLASLGRQTIGVQMGSQRTAARGRPGARPDLKALPAEAWRSFVVRLLDEGHADGVVFHGAPGETAGIRRFLASLPAAARRRCHDVSASVGLDLLPAVLAEHHALASVDTGPAHVAGAVGCPVLVFFGPTDPAVFAPLSNGPVELLVGSAPCQFCHGTSLYKTCRDNVCLSGLDGGRVWRAWERLYERIPRRLEGGDAVK